jgi:uncharacterized protein YlzI (FlbEa/FlbD family)
MATTAATLPERVNARRVESVVARIDTTITVASGKYVS